MRVVFMGTPDFSVGTLEALAAAGHEIVGVVTQPDKQKGRGKQVQPTPVKEAANRLGLPVYQPAKVRDPEFVETLRTLQPDVIVVVAFGQLIPASVLELPKYGCNNVHASLLPAYRGAAPIQWAVINGEKESGVTIMQMDAGLDTGDMLAKTVVPLDPEETGGSLFDKLSHAGAELLTETLEKLVQGTLVPEKQPEESPTEYARMIKKEDGRIDWTRPAAEIERLIRGMNPWPSAYTKLDGKTVKIWKAKVIAMIGGGLFEALPGQDPKKHAGEIWAADETGIHVRAGDGVLVIQELQLEGKKRMAVQDFLRGHKISAGSKFE